MTAIPLAETIKRAIHPTAKSVIDVFGTQQVRRHHRRKRERDYAGDEHSARKRQSELAEQRAV